MSKKIIANNNPDKFAMVDDDIFEIIQDMDLKFYVMKNGYFYSTKWIKLSGMEKKKRLLLHQFVWILKAGTEPTLTVDHEDRNKSNNQYSNLRLATSQQQKHNRGRQKSNTSGYIGVSHQHLNKRNKTGGNHYWRASIRKPDGKIEAKLFPYTDEGLIASAHWYDSKSIEYFGEFAVLNFPIK